MTKQAVIAIVVAVLIILGAAGAFLYSQTRSSNENAGTTATQTTGTPNKEMTNTVKDILTSGKNSKCTFTVGDKDTQTTGTIYTSGTNARGDFQTSLDGEKTTTHMIRNGDTFYMWGDSIAMGLKMIMSVDELASRMQGNQQFNSFNPEQEMDIKCVSWNQDASLFSPPTSVKFTSINTVKPTGVVRQTTGGPTISADSEESQCNICNSLTGNAKSTCLTQFNCN